MKVKGTDELVTNRCLKKKKYGQRLHNISNPGVYSERT